MHDGGAFVAFTHGPIVALLFGERHTQNAALGRIEAFYESPLHASAYLSVADAQSAKVCAGYEAYNFPTHALQRWYGALDRAAGNVPSTEEQGMGATAEGGGAAPSAETPANRLTRDATRTGGALPASYLAACTPEEVAVLIYFAGLGMLPDAATDAGAAPAEVPTYVIAALVSNADAAFAHERLHALYHLSPSYRALLARLWADLPALNRKAIAFDLGRRGYREEVWEDEFGAYLGVRVDAPSKRTDPAQEFGNKNAAACRDVRQALLRSIPKFWEDDVDLDEASLALTAEQLSEARQRLVRLRTRAQPVSKSTRGKKRR